MPGSRPNWLCLLLSIACCGLVAGCYGLDTATRIAQLGFEECTRGRVGVGHLRDRSPPV